MLLAKSKKRKIQKNSERNSTKNISNFSIFPNFQNDQEGNAEVLIAEEIRRKHFMRQNNALILNFSEEKMSQFSETKFQLKVRSKPFKKWLAKGLQFLCQPNWENSTNQNH